ncbi:MAG: glycosyltransferase family 2 protein [Chloroflexota bacterium]
MKDNGPKVSIGLPVYNGEGFLAEAIESVLSQTYQDLELVISDNASTDKTEEICRAFAEKDDRVRYFRSEKNYGASWNYNQTFELSKGEYFRWHAADDVLEPYLVEKSVEVLDKNPEVVLVFSWVQDINEAGEPVQLKKSGVGSRLPLPHQRFKGLSTVKPAFNCEEVFGMARRALLAKTKLIAPYSDSDRTLLAELGLYGPFYEIEEPLFLHRLHDKGSVVVNPDRQSRTAWFDTSKADKLVFPSWRQLGELLSVIWRTPIGWQERLYCYGHMLYWIKRRRVHLRKDLVWAIRRIG